MHILYSVILIGCLHIREGSTSYQYYYTQPYVPPIQSYYHVVNPAPQFYVQHPNYFQAETEPEITERPINVPGIRNLEPTTINNYENDQKYLGFGYRTEHDNGHSNVLFISSSDANQLGNSLPDLFKDSTNNLTDTAKNVASDAVDANAQIQFPSSDLDDTLLNFLQKPVTSFYAFYTHNNKVVAKDNYQSERQNNPNLLNNRILELFSRFGFDTRTDAKEMNQTQMSNTTATIDLNSRSAKALDLNETVASTTNDISLEATTQMITPSASTTETATTISSTEESKTNTPESTTVELTTVAVTTAASDKIETLA